MIRRLHAALLLGAALLLPCGARGADAPARGVEPAPVAEDPFASAAPDTWPMQDGCPARTRASRTRPVTGAVETAWTFEAPGYIEGDPRVWRDHVVVASSSWDTGESHLDVLRLSDGQPVTSRKTWKYRGWIDPVLWHDYILASTGDGVLEVLGIEPVLRMLPTVRKLAALPGPVVVDGDVLVVAGATIERRRLGQEEPVWAARPGGRVLGRLSVTEGAVWAVTSRTKEGFQGNECCLERFSLADGRALGEDLALGWLTEEPPPPGWDLPYVAVGQEEVFVIHPPGVALKTGPAAVASRVVRAGNRVAGAVPFHLASRPILVGPHAILVVQNEGEGTVLARSTPRDEPESRFRAWRWGLLASKDRHASFVGDAAAAAADGVVLAGAGFYDANTRQVIEHHASVREGFAIPARETLLQVEEGRRVRALRAKRSTTQGYGPRLARDPAGARVDLPGGSVVGRDGVVRTGALAFTPADGRVSGGGKGTLPIEDVGLLLDKSGRILHGPDAAFVTRALARAAAARTRSEWASLGRFAASSRDLPTLQRAIADLMERGGKPDDVFALQKERGRLERPSVTALGPDARKAAEAAKRRHDLLAREADVAWTACASLPDTVSLGYRADLLRALLALDPDHAEATAWLRARLPEGLVAPGAAFPATEWLDVVEAAGQTPLRAVAAKEGTGLSDDERMLAAARRAWRQDLVALRSRRLLLVTPVSAPGRIAKCLSLGEVVCAALDDLFGVRGDAEATAEPLVIHLYESREEYVARSPAATRDEGGRAFVEGTAGHYSPGEGVSRLYLPGGADATERVLGTIAHELTHHWLDRRLPVPEGARRSPSAPESPGYFLEEGFATLVEEFRFDLRARSWRTLDPRADSLDAVTSAPQALDWEHLLEMTQADFRLLDRAPTIEVPCRWTLGQHRLMSQTNLFYAQAGAFCHWLLDADGGSRRETLLGWVRDFHAGRTGPGEAQRRLRLSPRDAGTAVRRWSRETSTGGE